MLAGISDAGGVEALIQRVADGVTLRELALGIGCSRAMLGEWLLNDPERRALYHSARAASASALAEESLELADKSSETGSSKARLQIETRQWLAGVYDREQYGPKASNIQVNVGMLHIDAMRRASAEDAPVQVIDTKALPE
jgi:hypothetical protein